MSAGTVSKKAIDPRHSKYGSWSDSTGYYDRHPAVTLSPFKTEKSLVESPSLEVLRTSVNINNEQRERNRSQVVRREVDDSLQLLKRATLFTKDFVDIKAWQNIADSYHYEIDKWEEAFFYYAQVVNERDGEQLLKVDDILLVLDRVLDAPRGDVSAQQAGVPIFVKEKFKVIGFNKSEKRLLSWDTFK